MLGDAIHGAVLAAIPGYGGHSAQMQREIAEHCGDHGEATYETLRDGVPPSHERLAFVRATASRRARQNIPLAALLHTYRAGYMAVWETVRARVGGAGADLDTMMLASELAMEYFNAISSEATQAYFAERERIGAETRRAQAQLVEDLLTGELQHTDESAPQLGAHGLHRRHGCRVLLIEAATAENGPAPLVGAQTIEDITAALRAQDSVPLAAVVHGRVVVVLPPDAEVARLVETTLPQLTSPAGAYMRAGLSTLRPALREAPQAYAEARLALRIASRDRPFVPLETARLFDAMLAESEDTLGRLTPAWSEDLRQEDVSGELQDTLHAYLDGELNVGRAAKRLGVHPNTVRYRLQRIETITGGSTRDFHQLVEIFVVTCQLRRSRAI